MNIISNLESVLFVSEKPLTAKELARILETQENVIKDSILQLQLEYEKNNRGVRMVTNGNTFELASSPENFDAVKKVIRYENANMTEAKIETLTILAYLGPITKAELEQIRGVNCSLILKNLAIEDLTEETVENDLIKYRVSTAFLNALGLNNVSNLPNYETLHDKKTTILC